MPEEKKAAEKTGKAEKSAQPGKLSKILQWFKTLPGRIAKPFRNMYYELKKVSWPSKEKLISYSTIVLIFMLLMGVVIGLLDMGASAGVRLLIPKTSSSAATVVEDVEETAEEATETAATAEATEAPAEKTAEETEAPAEEATRTVEEATGEGTEKTEDSASGEN